MAKALADQYHIFALDLPEHGNSPHRPSTSLTEMNDQVTQWINHHLKEEYVLCGHSLGGKVAMAHACAQSKHMKGLVVVDIAPRDYPPEHHLPTLEAMLSLDLNNLESRKDADNKLSATIPNWAFRQFLLTNLKEDDGAWTWQSNLPVLRRSMPNLSQNPLSVNNSYIGPTLFVRGGKSGYLRSEHFSQIMDFFPAAKIETILEVGHDVHVEDRAGFLQHLTQFLPSM